LLTGASNLIYENREGAKLFVKNKFTRQAYRRAYPTQFAICECSDERVDLATVTDTLPGIFQTWANIGCRFDFENWDRFKRSFGGLVAYVKTHRQKMVVIVLDHFSRSDNRKFGCAGHQCDLAQTRASSESLKRQIEKIYPHDPDIRVIHVSKETDEGALLFHSDGNGIFDLGMIRVKLPLGAIRTDFEVMYQNTKRPFTDQQLSDLAAIASRNLSYLQKVRASPGRSSCFGHRGWVLNVGQGSMGWLRKHHTALVISPFDPRFKDRVRIAGNVLAASTRRKDFDRNQGITLLSSAPFRPSHPASLNAAEQKALDLDQEAMAVLERNEELRPYLSHLVVTVNMETCEANILDGSD
jgi:hypothetical protein